MTSHPSSPSTLNKKINTVHVMCAKNLLRAAPMMAYELAQILKIHYFLINFATASRTYVNIGPLLCFIYKTK